MDKPYFSHDFNARNDPKLQQVLMELGCEGIGLYWCIVEQLYEQGGKLPMSAIKIIAFSLRVKMATVQRLINDFDLFKTTENNLLSESVLKRMKKREEITQKRRIAGQRGGAPKGNKNAVKSEDGKFETTKKQPKNNQKQAIKEKESKVNNNTIDNILIDNVTKNIMEGVPPCVCDEGCDKNNTQTKSEEITEIEFISPVMIRCDKFIEEVEKLQEIYPKEMLDEFVRYWTETDFQQKNKMRFEFQNTFDIPFRVSQWFKKTTNPKKNK